mgnify:CR=1 FL=1
MLTADKLKTLTNLGPCGLSTFLTQSGYKGQSFKTVKFLGITNGGQLCYSVTYPEDSAKSEEVGKVFITYNHINNSITADC